MAASVLVTGATGFTGGHLAHRLVAQGLKVRVLVRDLDRAKPLAQAGMELAVGDLTDARSLSQATTGIGLVYHIAATFRQQGIEDRLFAEINAEGVRRLLDAAVGNGVGRVVHCSTGGVHGDIKNPPADENTPYGAGDLYQETKLAGEKIAQSYQRGGAIEVAIFRPTGIYGPGDLRFLKLFRAIKKRRFPMIGSGKVSYHMTYIDDLVDGIILCGTCPQAAGQIYILAGEHCTSLNELVGTIAEVLRVPPPRLHIPLWPVYMAGAVCEALCRPFGIEPPLYRRRVDFFSKNRAFNTDKARRQLNFQPKVALIDGIRRTADWYVEHGHL